MNEHNVDASIYRCGSIINNFEFPRLAKHSSVIQLLNSRMKEWIFHSTSLNYKYMM